MTTITTGTSSMFRVLASMLLASVLVFAPFAPVAQAEDPITDPAPAGDPPADPITDPLPPTDPVLEPGSDETSFVPLVDDTFVESGAIADLQEAIDEAEVGDSIVVSGSYTGDLTVGNSVVLTASTTGATITGQVTITASDVEFSGFTVTNPTGSFGISINAVGNVTVSDNEVHHVGTELSAGSAQGIYFTGSASPLSGVTIEGNTVSDIGNLSLVRGDSGSSAKGIYIGHTAAGNSTITDLEISNNDISDIFASTAAFNSGNGGRGAYGILINYQGATTATISGNTIQTLEGLWAHGIGLEKNTPNTVLSGNSVSGLTDHKGDLDEHAIFFESNPGMTSVTLNGDALGSLSDVAVNKAWTGYSANPVVTLNGDSYIFGVNAFTTIQAGVNAATGGTVQVAAGTYNEDIVVNKNIVLSGAGIDETIISGPKDGSADTVQIGGGATVEGFTITRDGNTVSDWNNANGVLNNQGVNFLQSPTSNSTLRDSKITGNRNGIYMNNSQGNTITGNIITENRTGIQFANNISDLEMTENEITDNFTLGVLFNFVSGVPTSGTNVKVNNNIITGNWYGAIYSRSQASMSVFDVTNNYYGHAVVTTTASDSTEPGYAAQIPVVFGGTAVAPDPAPADIGGTGLAFLTYAPWIGDEDGDEVVSVNETATTTTTVAEGGIVLSVEVAEGTVITGDEDWDGDVEALLEVEAVATVELDSIEIDGFEDITPTAAIEIGSSDNSFLLSKAARILLSGQAGQRAGWTIDADGEDFSPITRVCTADDQATVDTQLGEGEDCKIDVGADLVIWTKHFTTFVAYSADVVSTGGGSGGRPNNPRSTNSSNSSTGGSTGGQVLGASTYNFTANLTIGSTGTDVTELQTILIAAGHLKIAAPTGFYGPMTRSAVMAWQASAGLPATGFFGPLSRAKLNAGASATTTTTTTPAATTLTVGSRGEAVVTLQKQLIDAGFLKIGAPTGYFGPLTQAAEAAWKASASASTTPAN